MSAQPHHDPSSLELVGLPGFRPFANFVTQFYGPYGYAVSPLGVVVGALWGFVEGFVHFGIFACSTIWCWDACEAEFL
jgi:hypothetical protein